MTTRPVPVPQYLPCIIERDAETDLFVGHCLTYDLVSTSKHFKEAIDNLRALIKLHIEYSYTHYKEGFTVTADDADWQRWKEMVNSGQLLQFTVEPIEVSFNEPWTSPAFWASVSVSKEAQSFDESDTHNVCAPS